jgi:hypothetical protein
MHSRRFIVRARVTLHFVLIRVSGGLFAYLARFFVLGRGGKGSGINGVVEQSSLGPRKTDIRAQASYEE